MSRTPIDITIIPHVKPLIGSTTTSISVGEYLYNVFFDRVLDGVQNPIINTSGLRGITSTSFITNSDNARIGVQVRGNWTIEAGRSYPDSAIIRVWLTENITTYATSGDQTSGVVTLYDYTQPLSINGPPASGLGFGNFIQDSIVGRSPTSHIGNYADDDRGYGDNWDYNVQSHIEQGATAFSLVIKGVNVIAGHVYSLKVSGPSGNILYPGAFNLPPGVAIVDLIHAGSAPFIVPSYRDAGYATYNSTGYSITNDVGVSGSEVPLFAIIFRGFPGVVSDTVGAAANYVRQDYSFMCPPQPLRPGGFPATPDPFTDYPLVSGYIPLTIVLRDITTGETVTATWSMTLTQENVVGNEPTGAQNHVVGYYIAENSTSGVTLREIALYPGNGYDSIWGRWTLGTSSVPYLFLGKLPWLTTKYDKWLAYSPTENSVPGTGVTIIYGTTAQTSWETLRANMSVGGLKISNVSGILTTFSASQAEKFFKYRAVNFVYVNIGIMENFTNTEFKLVPYSGANKFDVAIPTGFRNPGVSPSVKGYDAWNIASGTAADPIPFRLPTITIQLRKAIATGGCVTFDTTIEMADGSLKPAGEIRVGDMVVSKRYNNSTIFDSCPVVDVMVYQDQIIKKIVLDNGVVLKCSNQHRMYVPSKDAYYDADSLVLGDKVGYYNRHDNTLYPVGIMSIEDLPSDRVVTFTVQDNHNYISSGIISHNKVIDCVLPGTLVSMADGSTKNVEDVVPGEMVLSYNTETGAYEPNEVVSLYHTVRDDYATIVLDNGTVLRCSPTHTVLSSNGTWVNLIELKAAMDCGLETKIQVYNQSVEFSAVSTIEFTEAPRTVVHLMEVRNNHTLLTNGVVAHNTKIKFM